MRKFIITNKDVILFKVDKYGIPNHITYKYKGTDIIGAEQLIVFLNYEAEQIVKEKYFKEEIVKLVKEIKLIGVKPSELKRIFKYVEFVET